MRETKFTILKPSLEGKRPGSAWISAFLFLKWTGENFFLPTLRVVVLLALLLLWNEVSFAQCAMVCNDDVNVSLPGPADGCELEITVDLVMEDTSGCANNLSVTVMDEFGFPLPNSPFVDASYAGQSLLYQVFDIAKKVGYQCVEVMCWPVGKAERRYAGVTHIDATKNDPEYRR